MVDNLHVCSAEREGSMWLVRSEEYPDVAVRVRVVESARSAVARALASRLRVSETSVRVRVVPVPVRSHLARAGRLRKAGADANRLAATERRAAARLLQRDGYSLRDIGAIMGVSHQRAHQLVAVGPDEDRPAPDVVAMFDVVLADLDAIHAQIRAADERTAETVTRVSAARHVLRSDRDRQRRDRHSE